MTRPNLFGLERAALAGAIHELGEPAYRASQVYSWLYPKRARAFEEMTNLGKDLRERLGAAWELRWPEVQERSLSYDGTRKYLFRLDDGATIESVSIPEESSPHHLHLHPGGLSPEVRVLPDRYRRVQAQPQDLGDPRPGGHRDGGGAAHDGALEHRGHGDG